MPSELEALGQDTRMRILVDARSLLPIGPGLGPTGVGRWTAGVIGGLSRHAPTWDIALTIVTREPVAIDPSTFGPNVTLRNVRFPERGFRRALVLGLAPRIERFAGRSDVMLGPGFVTWPGRHARIPVIHDLAWLTHPESVQPRNLAYLRLMIPRVVRNAAGLVTVSDSVRDEIAERFEFDPARIFVVPNGCVPQPPLPIEQRDHLLFVGTFEPRKNLERVLEAYRLVRAERPDVPDLVVVGGPGWRGAEELQRNAESTDGVRTLGYVDDEHLALLYRQARMLVFPSLYEGFGLPIIEAMAAGTPVITSNSGAQAEVAGGAALLVDPMSGRDIAYGITRVLDDTNLVRNLSEQGGRVAASFTWERSGLALKNAIESSVGRT
jgi:glycosyltransferase involved in cell wall biosynthesis